jgi:hypothetical protein
MTCKRGNQRKAKGAALNRREMIQGMAGLLAVKAIAASAQATREPAASPATSNPDSRTMADRAELCQSQVMEVARGPGGLIISHSRFDIRLPLQEGDIPPSLHRVLDAVWGTDSPKPTVAEWYYGENTLWATGWMLRGQLARYRVTQEERALALARKCFQDLNHVFDLSRTIEPGLLGKPHGGRAGATTSFDQSAIPVLPYAQFALSYATPQEKEQARRNLHDHADYYIRRNWLVNHHGKLVRIVPAGHTSAMKYFAAVHAAYDVTGEERYRDEAVKCVRQLISKGMIPWPSKMYAPDVGNLHYYSYLGEYWSKTSLAKDADWIGDIGLNWKVAQTALTDEGLVVDGKYDIKTKQFVPDAKNPTGYQGRTGGSLLVALLGLLARSHGLDDKAQEIARKILVRVDPSTFRQCFDDGHLSENDRAYANLFPAETPAMWLCTYWLGREQKAW